MTSSVQALAGVVDAARRPGTVVAVRAMPGMGKTWTLRTAGSILESEGIPVLRGSATEGAWARPWGLWHDALGPRFTAATENLATRAGEALPALTEAVRAAIDDRRHLVTPTVVLDDLHWADDDSLLLLTRLVRDADTLACSIVVAYRHLTHLTRPTIDALSAELAKAGTRLFVDLDAFSPAEAEALARAELTADGGDAAPIERILRSAGGNPLFIRELARAVAEGTASVEDLDDPRRLPAGITGVIRRRVAALPESAQLLLADLAVLPAPFGPAVARVLAGGTTEPLDGDAFVDALDALLAAGLLVADPAGYRFEHDVVRHAVTGMEGPERARGRRRRAALALAAAMESGRVPDGPELVAGLFASSGGLDGDEAGSSWCARAAATASRHGAHAQAVELRRHQVALLAASPVLARLAAQADLTGALADALLEEEAGESLTRTAALGTEVSSAEAETERSDAAMTATRSLVDAVLALKRAGFPATSWRTLVEIGAQVANRVEPTASTANEGRDELTAVLALLKDPVDPVTSGRLRAGRWRGHDPTTVEALRDRHEGAARLDHAELLLQPYDRHPVEELDGWLRLALAHPHHPGALHVLDAVGRERYFRHGDVAGADECYALLADSAERTGRIALHADALAQRSLCLAVSGDVGDAAALVAQARSVAAPLGEAHRVRAVTELLAPALLGFVTGVGPFDAWADANLTYARSAGAAGNVTAPSAAAFATLLLGLAGDRAGVDDVSLELIGLFEQLGPDAYVVNGGLALATRGLFEAGATAALPRFEALADELERREISTGPLGTMAGVRGLLRALAGDRATALVLLRTHRDDARSRGLAAVAALGDFDLARVEGAPTAELAKIGDAFDRLGMTGWGARARAAASLPVTGSDAPPTDGRQRAGVLSRREEEVLGLLASGRTNKEIAGDLGISLATAQRHVANIYLKIDARNRAEATNWALRSGLGPPRP